MKLLPLFVLLFLVVACKKEKDKPALEIPEATFHIVNQGDTNVSSFNLTVELSNPAGTSFGGRHEVFMDIQPFDTASIVLGGPLNTHDYINWGRNIELRIGFKKKVFSPILYANNYIVNGDPYLVGWTFSRRYNNTLLPDTLRAPADKEFYFYWPADSLKLKEIF